MQSDPTRNVYHEYLYYSFLLLKLAFNDMSSNHPYSSSDWCLECFQTLSTAALFLSIRGAVLYVLVRVSIHLHTISLCVRVWWQTRWKLLESAEPMSFKQNLNKVGSQDKRSYGECLRLDIDTEWKSGMKECVLRSTGTNQAMIWWFSGQKTTRHLWQNWV